MHTPNSFSRLKSSLGQRRLRRLARIGLWSLLVALVLSAWPGKARMGAGKPGATRAVSAALSRLARLAEPVTGSSYQQHTDQVPPFPNDLSPAGLLALISQSAEPTKYQNLLPPEVINAARRYAQETRAQGKLSRAGRLSVTAAPANVMANNPAGDAVGETQGEVAIAVSGNQVVIGWNDSRGFVAGNTVSSYGYSTDGGVTFVDGGECFQSGTQPAQADADEHGGVDDPDLPAELLGATRKSGPGRAARLSPRAFLFARAACLIDRLPVRA